MPGPETNPYTSQTISGYNSSPPSNDGATTDANKIKWSTIKEKLPDPIKTLVEAINTQNVSAFGKGINADNDERNTIGGNIAYTSSELTISSGVVTQTRAHHTIDTESDASTDDLDRLNNSSADAGTICWLRQEASGRAVTVKHQGGSGDGQFNLTNSEDFTLGANGVLTVIRVSTSWYEIARSSAATAAPRSYLAGLGLTVGTDASHDIDIAAGIARNSDNTDTLSLSSTLVKQIDAAWAVGSAAGGLDTGTVGNDSWYHVHLIKRSNTGVVDALFSLSVASPTMPTDYDKRRRIGSVLTDGSANIIAFTQEGDEFLWNSPPLDIDTTQGTSTASHTLSTPLGVKTRAWLNVHTTASSQAIYFRSLDQDDEQASKTVAPLLSIQDTGEENTLYIRTDTSSQIGGRAATSSAIKIVTLGWLDQRGRDD